MTDTQLRSLRRGTLANTLAWVGAILLIAVGLYFVDQRDADRQRDICGLIVLFDDAYRAQPPTTSTGRRVAAEMHAYRERIGCPS